MCILSYSSQKLHPSFENNVDLRHFRNLCLSQDSNCRKLHTRQCTVTLGSSRHSAPSVTEVNLVREMRTELPPPATNPTFLSQDP
jgi:hypothetical protein